MAVTTPPRPMMALNRYAIAVGMVCIGAVALLPSVAGNYNETKFQQLRQDLNDTQNEVKELKQQMVQKEDFADIQETLTGFFLLVMGLLVFFMQIGFALLEAGSISSSSVVNILFKNMADSLVGILAWWSLGFGLAYGDGNESDYSGDSKYFLAEADAKDYPSFFFQWTFAATAATIVSGAMAGRTQLTGYLAYTFVLIGWVYPTIVHWTWSENGKAWLTRGEDNDEAAGYTDFAGSGIVHCCGGTAALIGAIMVGPRPGRPDKYHADGHSMPLVALGTGILIFGFFAFNGGSVLQLESTNDLKIISLAMINTIMAASGGSIVALLVQQVINKKWSLLMLCNGAIAGMVSICASANQVYPWAAFVIGIVGGAAFITWSKALARYGVDDAIDAVGVHLGAGIWGVIAVPLFSFHPDKSIFYSTSGGSKLAWYIFAWNVAGVLAIIVYTAAVMAPLFYALKMAGLLRVSDDHLKQGIDIVEHGERAYTYGDAVYFGKDANRTEPEKQTGPNVMTTTNTAV